MPSFTLHRGDCLAVLRTFPDNHFDSIVTDPPYGISFMSAKWDYDVPPVDVWREAMRVLKPGGHLLAFSGTRTYHRMVTNIEDGGFEIRDQCMWVFGSGFPKSLDISKAIDKASGAERDEAGSSADRRGDGTVYALGMSGKKTSGVAITAAAAAWQGWGSALKPAHEPVCVARKPLSEKTVAANVLKHGTGGINIDACRVELDGSTDAATFEANHRVVERLPDEYADRKLGMHDGGWMQKVGDAVVPTGRWPANLLHDGSDEVVSAFPLAKGQQGDLKNHTRSRKSNGIYGDMPARADHVKRVAAGSAARFFYSPKASRRDREEGLAGFAKVNNSDWPQNLDGDDKRGSAPRANNHPTVKPTEVCRWLLRLVTPPGGLTLDPYCGSGSFGKAAMLEGFNFVGIDLDEDGEGDPLGYLDIARARIAHAQAEAFDRECEDNEL